MPEYKIPCWNELPSIDLYMDQVIELVNGYLKIFSMLSGEGYEITRPMINNYVKLKMMPAPEKKKYSKRHLAYIMIICTLKQSLNISTIQKIIPTDKTEDEVKYIYNSFVENQKKAFDYIYDQIEKLAAPIVKAEDDDPDNIYALVMQIVSSANILKCLSEKIINTDKSE